MPTPNRRDRLTDLAALVLILLGAALCVVANIRLQDISRLSYRHPGPPTVSQLAAADRARYLAYGGVGLILGGCAVAGVGAVRVARRPRTVVS